MPQTAISRDPAARLAERQSWITDSAQESVQSAVAEAFDELGGDKLRSVLHGDWLHEPLHVVLTDVPVGAWTAAVAFDAIGAIASNRAMDTAADACVSLGLVGAVGAAITGMNDWADVKETAPRRIGAVHGILNVIATGAFVGSLIARKSPANRTTARALAALGFLVVSASAHLGGNMIYEHGVGVSKPG
jgi:uncharacterized membrane protein